MVKTFNYISEKKKKIVPFIVNTRFNLNVRFLLIIQNFHIFKKKLKKVIFLEKNWLGYDFCKKIVNKFSLFIICIERLFPSNFLDHLLDILNILIPLNIIFRQVLLFVCMANPDWKNIYKTTDSMMPQNLMDLLGKSTFLIIL